MSTCKLAAVALAAIAAAALSVQAGTIPVSNYSFESPQTTFAQPGADDWTTGGPATFGAGVFLNPPPGQSGNISNAVGNQLAFISTQTGTELSQIVSANYEPGQLYELRVGVAKSLVSPPGTSDKLRIELFYVDQANVRQSVAMTDVTNDSATGLSNSQLKYFDARTPILQSTDASVNQPIGILFTTIGTGGFLDLDNVTLTSAPPLALLGDINQDGAVNFPDLLVLAQHYGQPAGLSNGDFNNDGAVGFDDLLVLAQHYDQTAGAAINGASVAAEPSCAAVFLLAIGLAIRPRFRR